MIDKIAHYVVGLAVIGAAWAGAAAHLISGTDALGVTLTFGGALVGISGVVAGINLANPTTTASTPAAPAVPAAPAAGTMTPQAA